MELHFYKTIWLLMAYCLSYSSISTLAGQNNDTTTRFNRATKYIHQAKSYYEEAQYQKALNEYHFAGVIYRDFKAMDKYAICYNGIGNIYINLTRFDEARSEFTRALTGLTELQLADSSFRIDSLLIADAYEGLGRYFSNKNSQLDSSFYYHQKALDIRTRLNPNSTDIGMSYYFIGQLYRGLQLDSAQIAAGKSNVELERYYLEEAKHIFEQSPDRAMYLAPLADIYQALGDYCYDVLQNFEEGLSYHQEALELRKKRFTEAHPNTALSFLRLAKYHARYHNYALEVENIEKALSIQEKIYDGAHKDLAHTLQRLAERYKNNGDVEKALFLYNRAMNMIKTLSGESSTEYADILLGIAACNSTLENFEEQEQILHTVLNIYKKAYGPNHQQIGVIQTQIGHMMLDKAKNTTNKNIAQAQINAAFEAFENAKNIWERVFGKNHIWVAEAYENIAEVFAINPDSDPKQELEYLKAALALKTNSNTQTLEAEYQNIYIDEHDISSTKRRTIPAEIYHNYMKQAKYYAKNKQYKDGLHYIQLGLNQLFGLPTNTNYSNPTIAQLSQNIEWLDAMSLKAKLLLNNYAQYKRKEDLDFALQTAELALQVVDTMRINFTADISKEQLTKRAIPIYETAIEAQYYLYNQNGDSTHLAKAFNIMEHSKAFVLMQAIQNNVARNAGLVPEDLWKKENELKQKLADLSDYKNKKANSAENEKEYLQTRKSYDSLITYIESNYPKYYQLKYAQSNISIQDIQQKVLRKSEALIEYFVGDDYIYVFTISKTHVQLSRKKNSPQIVSKIDALRKNLTNYKLIAKDPEKAFRQFADYAYQVYAECFQPFLGPNQMPIINPSNTKRLIIVPDGLLSSIPFDVLVQESLSENTESTYRELPMLIKDYEINYSYSSSLLFQNIQTARRNHNGQCIGFAPTYKSEEGLDNAELPWAEKELKAISENFKGAFFYGQDANKENFNAQAKSYGIIHLAMHGILDMNRPQESHLAFSAAGTDSSAQNINLYNYEIQNMDLFAELVVLSACETGYGKVIRGEGVLSLARGFMLAGSSSIVTTLWKVNDYTSATLMTLFYQNLDKGMDKPEALRKAKLDFLQKTDKTSGHPAYWSSFISLGNPAPIKKNFPIWASILITIVLGTAIYSAYQYWRKNKASTALIEKE